MTSGLSRLRNMFRVADLRNKILFTLFMVFVFRLGSHIPVPFVDFKAVQALSESAQNKGGGGGNYGPGGPYGAYPGCGCSSLFIILAGILLVFGGCLRLLGQ